MGGAFVHFYCALYFREFFTEERQVVVAEVENVAAFRIPLGKQNFRTGTVIIADLQMLFDIVKNRIANDFPGALFG